MSWDALAAIGETVGALGVIASLVYLAIQIRANAAQTRQAAAQSVLTKINSVLENMSTSPQMAELWTRAAGGFANLESDSERVQCSGMFLSVFRPYEELFYYRRARAVEEWTWESMGALLETIVSTPGFADWWALRAGFFTRAFQEHVNELVPSDSHNLIADYEKLAALSAVEPTESNAGA